VPRVDSEVCAQLEPLPTHRLAPEGGAAVCVCVDSVEDGSMERGACCGLASRVQITDARWVRSRVDSPREADGFV